MSTRTEKTNASPDATSTASTRTHRRLLIQIAVGIVAAAFVIVGGLGLTQYVHTFWLYRGFAAPAHVKQVTFGTGSRRRTVAVEAGSVETFSLVTRALGNRRVEVIVYLPPGYTANPGERYPVFYLLHGYPGVPSQFITIGDVAVTSDVLIAERRIKPMILVMPDGSTSFFADHEWANSVKPGNDWETFVARDVVGAIDHRYRTVPSGGDRAVGGLSEGAYGAMNLAFHHLGEFDLAESWSGYFAVDRTSAANLFGDHIGVIQYNSPAIEAPRIASQLRARHIYLWLYAGTRDGERFASRRFVTELTQLGIAHAYSEHPGRHNWRLWRSMMIPSLEVASAHFAPVPRAA